MHLYCCITLLLRVIQDHEKRVRLYFRVFMSLKAKFLYIGVHIPLGKFIASGYPKMTKKFKEDNILPHCEPVMDYVAMSVRGALPK